ncbi:aldose epimerase family protein [Deinococcus arcticus]|uniref:Aldose 1-epimerase n=1 Tax=Deinococcus arcticus TaxID=2136176 RepID=A0A2T3WBX0_9DEIO|nr:aldose epimerase family protein [Deinococcus arcticus]PTA69386.1 galactose-1-epimerase [Deinococcus arcticus]
MTLTPSIEAQPWGVTPAGEAVTLYTLHAGPLRAQIMNSGGVLVGLQAPDRCGTPAEVTLGHDHLAPYLSRETSPYFGALIGRFANRIAGGRFVLDGQPITLARNNGPNALHGGPGGFDGQPWQATPDTGPDHARLHLRRTSPDGEEGYPGTLQVEVTYTLTATELQLRYRAQTNRPTVLNLTNHTYWNLGGRRDILDHQLQVQAGRFTPTDKQAIPTGELQDVTGTPFDLRRPRRLGDVLALSHDQLTFAGGLDHNFVLDQPGLDQAAATLHDPASGRRLDVLTTQPGLQVYSGNFLDGRITGRGGQRYGPRWAVCLETQHFPDSPNQPHFPRTRLDPGETFESQTIYRFSVQGG